MPDYEKILLAVCPRGNKGVIAGLAASIPLAVAHAELTTDLRLAHALAQCAHESAGLSTTTEYASGRAYEGRKDLGNVQKGDGVRFKGRGLLQVTGRANYARVGKAIGIDLVSNPPVAATFPAAALSAAEYWRAHDLNKFADADDLRGVTLRVNGGYNGLASRAAYLAKAKHALADLKGALLARAGEETQKATVKSAGSGTAAASAVASLASLHPALANPVPHAAIAVIALSAVACAAGLVVSINQHKRAAAALTAAAKEI